MLIAVSLFPCCWPAGSEAQAVADWRWFYYWAPSCPRSLSLCQDTLISPGSPQTRRARAPGVPWHPAESEGFDVFVQANKLAGVSEDGKALRRQSLRRGNGALLPGQKHGVPRAHRGGGRLAPAQAGLEVRGPARRLLAVCGQHHRRPVHLRRGHPHHELWEESPGAKTKTQRKLTRVAPDNDIRRQTAAWRDWSLLLSVEHVLIVCDLDRFGRGERDFRCTASSRHGERRGKLSGKAGSASHGTGLPVTNGHGWKRPNCMQCCHFTTWWGARTCIRRCSSPCTRVSLLGTASTRPLLPPKKTQRRTTKENRFKLRWRRILNFSVCFTVFDDFKRTDLRGLCLFQCSLQTTRLSGDFQRMMINYIGCCFIMIKEVLLWDKFKCVL